MAADAEGNPLRPEHFKRYDESPDPEFYAQPRLVTHIDDAAIAAAGAFYARVLPAGGKVLDLMTSWVSHLPDASRYTGVAGLGMNAEELMANPQLTEWVVHDLNANPVLPWADGESCEKHGNSLTESASRSSVAMHEPQPRLTRRFVDGRSFFALLFLRLSTIAASRYSHRFAIA